MGSSKPKFKSLHVMNPKKAAINRRNQHVHPFSPIATITTYYSVKFSIPNFYIDINLVSHQPITSIYYYTSQPKIFNSILIIWHRNPYNAPKTII